MDDKTRLQLQKMISANNVEDQTELIRNLKHSEIIRQEIKNLLRVKSKYVNNNDANALNMEAAQECNFLFTYYTDIYNKIRKDEINLGILEKFLDVLKKIEDGELDQHEGSYFVGTLLKELYIDSALKKAEKMDKEYSLANNNNNTQTNRQPLAINWKQYKKMSNN